MSLEYIIEPEIPEDFELIGTGFIYQGEEVRLARREREILQQLTDNGCIEKQKYNRQYHLPRNSRSLDIWICRLNDKLRKVGIHLPINSIKDFGYIITSCKEQDFVVTEYGFQYKGTFYPLPPIESRFLRKLYSNPESTLTRRQLYYKHTRKSRLVDIVIFDLRKRLQQVNAPVKIETVHNQGYRLTP